MRSEQEQHRISCAQAHLAAASFVMPVTQAPVSTSARTRGLLRVAMSRSTSSPHDSRVAASAASSGGNGAIDGPLSSGVGCCTTFGPPLAGGSAATCFPSRRWCIMLRCRLPRRCCGDGMGAGSASTAEVVRVRPRGNRGRAIDNATPGELRERSGAGAATAVDSDGVAAAASSPPVGPCSSRVG